MSKPKRDTCQICSRPLDSKNCSDDHHTCVYCVRLAPCCLRIPQEIARYEAVKYVWENNKKCNPHKCDFNRCGTFCILVNDRLAVLGQLDLVIQWESLSRAKIGSPLDTPNDRREAIKQLRDVSGNIGEKGIDPATLKGIIVACENETEQIRQEFKQLAQGGIVFDQTRGRRSEGQGMV